MTRDEQCTQKHATGHKFRMGVHGRARKAFMNHQVYRGEFFSNAAAQFSRTNSIFLCCHTWTQHDRKLAAPKCFIGNLDLFVASLARVRLLLRKWALRRNKVVAPYWSIVKLVLCSGYFPKELRQNVEHLFLSKNSASVVYLRRIVAPSATLTVTVDIQ